MLLNVNHVKQCKSGIIPDGQCKSRKAYLKNTLVSVMDITACKIIMHQKYISKFDHMSIKFLFNVHCFE